LFFLLADEEFAVHAYRKVSSQTLADVLGTQLSILREPALDLFSRRY
jgi:hypothetical protein